MTMYLNALGIVNAMGRGKRAVLDGLLRGDTSGIQMLDDVLVEGGAIPFGAVMAPRDAVPDDLAAVSSGNMVLVITALNEIRDDIEQAVETYGADRVAVVAASSTAGIEEGEKAVAAYHADGAFPPGYAFARQEMGTVGNSIAEHFGLTGPALTLSTACSSSAKAFASARRLIRAGLADAVILGGADSFCRMTLNGFNALSALSHATCLPFSANRDGTVLGEGAAFFLVTREPGPLLLAGVGETSDAHNMTAPAPDGSGARQAMQAALADANLDAANIGYINLHGTATRLNDAAEAMAVADIFGAKVPCSSTKALTGHTLGAAGAMEAALCWLLLSDLNSEGSLPAHVWDSCNDPALPQIGLLTTERRLGPERPFWAMSNSYAFGGSNACVVIGRTK